MTIRTGKLVFAALGAAALGFFALVATTMTGQAATWGHAQWCAVTNNGGGDLMWECVFDTVEECQPFILAGNRGFCSLNPYWKGPNQQSDDDD
jgi:hypothetical protein